MIICPSHGDAYLLARDLAVENVSLSIYDSNPLYYITYPGGPITCRRFTNIIISYTTFHTIHANEAMTDWFRHEIARLDIGGRVIKID